MPPFCFIRFYSLETLHVKDYTGVQDCVAFSDGFLLQPWLATRLVEESKTPVIDDS